MFQFAKQRDLASNWRKLVFGLVNEHGETVSQAVFLAPAPASRFAGHERIALVEERSTLRMAGVRDAVVEGRGVFDEFQVSI